ncbi:uncharacterized protein TRUGW13939_11673 [Talaromyces rugulosus]|uniref:Uncharacterized protein n=1 Tax=Talaromyces rugulosus TaxID=121627 RepID=A0A7H8REP6_TALRU|nr:uncharacterized protein TRUGW13939_11673 [Talaromyces rugulosus]QKX64498.1 hypothetical protein TRUGW13939_11673 [Talaromyces rugulosus]
MRVSQIFTFFAFLLCSVAFKLPGNLRAERRQEVAPGTPLYECHANCGNAILISRTDNYCSNSTFTSGLEACLECALTEDIWQYYGDEVASAAKTCSDSATPSPSSASAATATGPGSTGTAAGLTSSVLATTTAAATPTSVGALSATGSGSTASATGSSGLSPTSTVAASDQTGAASSVFSSSGASIGVFLTIVKLVQTFV